MKKVINILIIDDHPAIYEGIAAMLNSTDRYLFLPRQAMNCDEALSVVRNQSVDIVLLDIELPIVDGIGTLRKIKSYKQQLPVLMVSFKTDLDIINQAIKSGANGFVSKLIQTSELIMAITSIMQGNKYFSNEISQILFNGRSNRKEDNKILTKREEEILELLCLDLTQLEIADKLNISPRTVEGHAKNLRTKLKAKSSAGMIMNAMKHGFLK